MRRALLAVAMALLMITAGCAGDGTNSAPSGGNGNGFGGNGNGGNGNAAAGNGGDGASVGVAVGGAQDAQGFRQNVREGYVPQPTAMTYEGLYHDYYFETGGDEPCEKLFCPSFSRAVTEDPLSGETERYVTVGLNSGLSKADFQRPKLNLVVVLDTSGSMDESFERYYYDGGQKQTAEQGITKMEAAKDAVATMLGHLDADDRVGVVTYDDNARVLQGVESVSELDRGRLRNRIRTVAPTGGTNLDAGMKAARRQAERYSEAEGYETRIVYVTDAMPNRGQVSADALERRLSANADRGIHATFLGVGVDFNSNLVESITDVRGGNYYSVHSPAGFRQRMDEGFQYMVTPLVYDLSLSIAGGQGAVEHVYGTPGGVGSNGKLFEVTTLFPSRSEGNKSEGSVILLELADGAVGRTVTIESSYVDPSGQRHEVTRTLELGTKEAPYYGSTGVRKAVALTRYATLMRNWAAYRRGALDGLPGAGIERQSGLGQWEQRSVPLNVSGAYRDRIRRFAQYFRSEKRALGAERMGKDLRLLYRLVPNATRSGPSEPTPDPSPPSD